jgi:hypothetical protein
MRSGCGCVRGFPWQSHDGRKGGDTPCAICAVRYGARKGVTDERYMKNLQSPYSVRRSGRKRG